MCTTEFWNSCANWLLLQWSPSDRSRVTRLLAQGQIVAVMCPLTPMYWLSIRWVVMQRGRAAFAVLETMAGRCREWANPWLWCQSPSPSLSQTCQPAHIMGGTLWLSQKLLPDLFLGQYSNIFPILGAHCKNPQLICWFSELYFETYLCNWLSKRWFCLKVNNIFSEEAKPC